MSDVAEGFARMIAYGMQVAAENKRKAEVVEYRRWRNESMKEKFADWSDDRLIKHWNEVGCNFECGEICCEDVHWELNRRGKGDICCV